MKKLTITLLFLTQTLFVFSQNCEEITSIVLSGDLHDYEVDDCIANVVIRTLDEDTVIKGITFVNTIESISMIPSDDYQISIKPYDHSDLINLYIVRGDEGNTVLEERPDIKCSLYPNPTDTNLSIDTELTIISYIIKDIQGNIYLKGNTPDNNIISVNTLQTGSYYITIVTANETIQKQFYKN